MPNEEHSGEPEKANPIRLNPEDPRVRRIGQMLDEAKIIQARGLTLEDSYIQHVTYANVGGMAACLGIADVLAGKAGKGIPSALPEVVWPMVFFFIGLIACGVVVSLRSKQSLHEAEEKAREANAELRKLGHGVVLPQGAFSPREAMVLPVLNSVINAAGLVAQGSFLLGAIWGICLIAKAH